jgi:peroxiredoxin
MRYSRALLVLLLTTIPQVSIPAENHAKDFTLPSATSKSLIHLSDYSGKVVLLNWWRTSCSWSQQESPRLVALYKKYHDQGLVIMGISDDETATVPQIPAYLNRYGITWPVGLSDQGEFTREILPLNLGQGDTPGNYLVSRTGEITYLGLDRSPAASAKIEDAVVRALAQVSPASSAIKPRELPRAPALSLPDLQGKPVSLQSFAGKPMVVNFFNSDSCDWAGAAVSKLSSDYARAGLQVIGVDLLDSDTDLKACMAKYKVQYQVLRGDTPTQTAWIGSSKAWAMFFVTPDGKVLKKIEDSKENGMEGPVFSKYAEYMLANQ